MRATKAILPVLLALVLGAAGCGESDSADDSGATPVTEQPAPEREPGSISTADVPKGEWPLTVREGVVRCEGTQGSGAVIFRAPDETDYAVNGTAKTARPELPEIDAIWKKPDEYGLRVNISPVLDRGLELCE